MAFTASGYLATSIRDGKMIPPLRGRGMALGRSPYKTIAATRM
jgi:hypothetical protein